MKRVPTHIGVIPDGNRRWAKNSGRPKHEGYGRGVAPGLELLLLAIEKGVQEISFYGFTTDNCKRPEDQIEAFSRACVDAAKAICTQSVSFLVLGNDRAALFPDELREFTTRKDVNGGGIKVNLLVNYGWEWDLAPICAPSDQADSRKRIVDCLHSNDISRMDLIIRWGGMRRLSGFLPVQSVYADFFVVDNLWPDFSPEDFYAALNWYDSQDITLGG